MSIQVALLNNGHYEIENNEETEMRKSTIMPLARFNAFMGDTPTRKTMVETVKPTGLKRKTKGRMPYGSHGSPVRKTV